MKSLINLFITVRYNERFVIMADYTYKDFEQAMVSNQPGFMETYVMPFLLIMASIKAGKKPLGRWTRRMLFTSGVYMMMRNYGRYKQGINTIANLDTTDIKLPETQIG